MDPELGRRLDRKQAIEDALERWRNSGGFACSDPTDDVMQVLMTLAQAYDDYRRSADA